VSLDIKTSVVESRRQTYANVARRQGADRPASRYDEATYDMQPTVNFHYRPTWDPGYLLYDPSRTAIRMDDWYALRDPRQLYYATYTIARARMMEAEEKNFDFVQKRGLLESVDDAWVDKLRRYMLPLRHYEWGANMNNTAITDLGYGTAITQAASFAAMDRLGIAQILSRVGLLIDGNSGDTLKGAKEAWLNDEMWQGVRKMVEDSFVLRDWFELFVAQNFAMDGVVYPLIYDHCDAQEARHGGGALSMLNEFMIDWFADHCRWVDAVLKVAAAESAENRELISGWASAWAGRAMQAFRPIAAFALEAGAEDAMAAIQAALKKRANSIGLEI